MMMRPCRLLQKGFTTTRRILFSYSFSMAFRVINGFFVTDFSSDYSIVQFIRGLVLEIETAFFFGTDFLWLCILFWIRYVFSYFFYNGNFLRILSLAFNFNRLDIFFHDVAFSIPSLIILKCHFISYMCVYLLILYLGKHSKRRSNNYTKKNFQYR